MYNQDDCTTDMTCIQKADENNLFVGFAKNKETIEKLRKLDYEISKMENNIKHLATEDRIIAEKFQNNHTPHEINDLIEPFSNNTIRPYNKVSNAKTLETNNMMETDGLCFHCKVGVCEGGVCQSAESVDIPGNSSHNDNNNLIQAAHPVSVILTLTPRIEEILLISVRNLCNITISEILFIIFYMSTII